MRGEELAIVVHGQAEIIDVDSETGAGYAACCREVYGAEWNTWEIPAIYARINAKTMFANTLGNWDD